MWISEGHNFLCTKTSLTAVYLRTFKIGTNIVTVTIKICHDHDAGEEDDDDDDDDDDDGGQQMKSESS